MEEISNKDNKNILEEVGNNNINNNNNNRQNLSLCSNILMTYSS